MALLPATPKNTAHAADTLDYVGFVNGFKTVVLESTKESSYSDFKETSAKKLIERKFPFTAEDINYIKQLNTFYIKVLAPFLYRATFQTTDPIPENVTNLLAACPQEDVPFFIERLVNALIEQNIHYSFINTPQALQNHPLGKLFRIEITKTIKCVDSVHEKTDQEARLNLQTTYYDTGEKKEKNFMTLQTCIEHTLSGQIIDYIPYGSSTNKRCTEKQQLINLSDIVILALNRFGWNKTTGKGIKFKHKISVPLEYDFARHLPENYARQTRYELVAAIEHLGNYGSGHYITYVREGKQWYICNDEHVFAINTNDIKDYSNKWGAASNEHRGIDYAYVYFYQKAAGPFQPKAPPKVEEISQAEKLRQEQEKEKRLAEEKRLEEERIKKEKLEIERKLKEETTRKAREEQQRLELERQKQIQEEKNKLEAEKLRQEQARLKQEQEKLAQEKEATRKTQEAEKLKQTQEAEKLRQEQARLKQEQEKLAQEKEATRKTQEAEQLKQAQEAEKLRQEQAKLKQEQEKLAQEMEEARKNKEAEQLKQAQEAEKLRQAEQAKLKQEQEKLTREMEEARKNKEAEQLKQAQEVEKLRQQQEKLKEDQAKLAQEIEEARKNKEAEQLKQAQEAEKLRQEQATLKQEQEKLAQQIEEARKARERPPKIEIPQEPSQQGDIKQLIESLQELIKQFKILEQTLQKQ